MVGRLKSELSQAQDTIAKLQAIASVGLDGGRMNAEKVKDWWCGWQGQIKQ